MQKLFDKLRAREAVTRRVCRVISVAAFALGAASVAIAVLAVTEVLIPRNL